VPILPEPSLLLYVSIAAAIVLAAIVIVRPSITASSGGKILAFMALFLVPLFVAFAGASEHMERSKQTEFCLSCHIMEPYGRSLRIDDASYVPAAHFQNARIPRDAACYTCHTDYVMYGGIRSKIRGLRHVYMQYLSTPPTPIKLYNPYQNRECLHCHAGARSFEQGAIHSADPSIMAAIKSGQMSCMTSGCHQNIHNVSHLAELKFWKEGK
jgi:cytochrome c-type protein NapC